MSPPRAKFSPASAVLPLVALGLGAGLGYAFWPVPRAIPAPAAVTAPLLPKPAPLTHKKAEAVVAAYDLSQVVGKTSQHLAQFEAWLGSASCAQVASLLLNPSLNGYPGQPPLTELIVRRFAQFGVEERFACLQNVLSGEAKLSNYELLKIFSALAKDTLPNRAPEMAALFKKGSQLNDHSIADALNDWAASDLSAALAFVQTLGQGSGSIVGTLIGRLAETDLPAAQQQALLLAPGSGREGAISSIASTLAKKDVKSALEWLRQNNVGDQLGAFGGDPFGTAMAAAASSPDPTAAAQLIRENPGLFEGSMGPYRVGQFFEAWAGRDSAAAAAWLEVHPLAEQHHNTALRALFQAKVASLPVDEAINQWQQLPEIARKHATYKIAERLAADDPATVLDRLATLVPADQRSEAMGQVLYMAIPPEHLSQVLRWLPEFAEFLEKNAHYAGQLSKLPAQELDEAMQKLPEKSRLQMQNALAEQVVHNDPERALALLPQIDRHSADPYVYSQIAVELANSDPAKAAAWVAGFEEGSSKEWASLNLVATWAKFDPDTATAWVEKLPAGNSRDRATLELAHLQGVSGGHEAALRLVAGVQDEGRRTEAAGLALQNLWRRDRSAAEAALAGLSLAPETRAELTAKLARGGFSR
jgi:hypothetical protein